MIKIVSLALISLLLNICVAEVRSGQWYEGGTLHSSTVREWKQSTYDNKLATSADWFVSITNSHNPSLKNQLRNLSGTQYLDTLKIHAAKLERCVSGIVKDVKIAKEEQKVAEYGSMCYSTLFGIK
jgi:hypothetical protein